MSKIPASQTSFFKSLTYFYWFTNIRCKIGRFKADVEQFDSDFQLDVSRINAPQTKLPPNESTTLVLKARGPRPGARDPGSPGEPGAFHLFGLGAVTPCYQSSDPDKPSNSNWAAATL